MLIFIFWILFSIIVGGIGSERKLSGGFLVSFLVSLFFTPIIGLILVLVSKPDKRKVEKAALASDMKKCPQCAELIKKEAVKCRFCGKSFESNA